MNKYLKVILTILVSLLIAGVLFAFESILTKFAKEYFNKYVALVITLNIPILLYFAVKVGFKKLYNISAEEFGFSIKSFFAKILIGSALGAFIIVSSLFVLLNLYALQWGFAQTTYNSILSILVTSIIIGGCEELFFRGFLNSVMIQNNISYFWTIIVSSLLFSAAHMVSFNPAETSYYWFLGIFLMGILFSLLYKIFDSIFVPIALHITWDVLSFGLNGSSDFKGFYISDFLSVTKNLDNIQTVIILILTSITFYYFKRQSSLTLAPCSDV